MPDRNAGACFTPSLQPHVLHPRVRALGLDAEDALLRRALARYLEATWVLELRVVNEVAAAIADGSTPFTFGDGARVDAEKLEGDESRHAHLADDLMTRLRLEPATAPPAFHRRFLRLREASPLPPEVVTFLFTVVSETLLSPALTTMARDGGVHPALRAFVAEHARDEAWHSTFFAARFAELWSPLSRRDRDRLGPEIPALVRAFLEPDLPAIAVDLESVGFAAEEARAVVSDAYPAASVLGDLRNASRPTLACLRRAGALHPGATRDAFTASGLLGEEA